MVIMGHFNAHHAVWGSHTSNALGRYIAEKTLSERLVFLNNGSATRLDTATGNTSAIDVTICSVNLASKFTWRTLADSHNSDHFPIAISLPGWSQTPTVRRKWLYDRADWAMYENTLSDSTRHRDEWNVAELTEEILKAAAECIPCTSGCVGPKAVPWWCPEVETAIKKRRKQLRALRRLPVSDPGIPDALARFQEARIAARKAVKEAKQQSWAKFVAKLSPNSTSTELWSTVNTLRGRKQHRPLVFKQTDGFTNDPIEVAEELAGHYSNISATSNYPLQFQRVKK